MSAFLFAACGDDDSSGFTTRPDEDSSLSVCEDCDDSSSSSSVTPQSSESETSVSSSSAKSSSSKNGDAKSSSSSAESFSSDASSISFFEDGVTGTMTDGRDGQTYKIVKIGEQIWMAENLNYAYLQPTEGLDSSSFCYNDSASYCEKYGRLYLWSAAMDSAGIWSTKAKGCGYGVKCNRGYGPVRGVCPDGWHLPSLDEWYALYEAVGGSTASEALRSTSGWYEWCDDDALDGTSCPVDTIASANGRDTYSFAVLPAGYRIRDYYRNRDFTRNRFLDSSFTNEGFEACFWSSSQEDFEIYADYMLVRSDGISPFDYAAKDHGFSVRCMRYE